MYQALSKADCDVYYQRVTSVLTLVTALFCRKRRRLMVWAAAHNEDCSKFRHLRELAIDNRFRRLSLGGLLSVPLNRLITDLAYHAGIRRARLRVAHTQEQRKMLAVSFGLNSELIYKGYPLPLNREKLVEGPCSNRPNSVVWIANLRDWKRPDAFIRLARNLAGEEVEFFMVGAPYRDLSIQREFEKKVAAVPGLHYQGRLSHEATLGRLRAACLLVHTSPSEGFSNVFIEAWMTHTPVLSFQFDPDGIIPRYGVGAVAQDFEELVQMCREFLNGGRRAAKKDFERVLRLFDMKLHGERLRKLIGSVEGLGLEGRAPQVSILEEQDSGDPE